MPFLLAPLGVGLALAAAALYWMRTLKQELYLQGLCYGMHSGGFERAARAGLPGGRIYRYRGRYQGREFHAEYRYRPRLFTRKPRAEGELPVGVKVADELEIHVPVLQKFWLRVLPRRVEDAAEDEVQTGIPDLDTSYVIHSNQAEAAREFLGSRFVQDELLRLRPFLERIEIYRGILSLLVVRPATAGFRRSHFETALEVLMRLSLDYVNRGLGFRLVAVLSSPLCPFCREDLTTAAGGPVVRCGACGTHLHADCWNENGQCTTWGCNGGASTAAER